MTQIRIIRPDNVVYVGGVSFNVKCDDLPSYVHAIHFDDSAGKGEIEFSVDPEGLKLPNLKIVDITPFRFVVERWNDAKVAKEREEARIAMEAEAAEAKRKEETLKLRSTRVDDEASGD